MSLLISTYEWLWSRLIHLNAFGPCSNPSCVVNHVQLAVIRPTYLYSGRPSNYLHLPLPWTLIMEHVHTRDNNSSPDPHPTENPTAPPTQIDPFPLTQKGKEPDAERPAPPSPSPPTANLHGGDKSRVSILQSLRRSFTNLRLKPPRSKPLFRGFERPSLSRIAILAVLCLITYPAFYVLTLVAKDRSLSMVRAIVSVWCSIVGFALGYVLLKIGTRHLEAASESTPVGRRDFLRLCSNSLGHGDPHEPRRWWDETPRSGQRLA